MKLTPLDIRHKEFHRGMRGYADAEVDEFLDNVADAFERIYKENIDLGERLGAVQAQLDHFRGIEATLQRTLVSAQQNCEEQRAAAQKEAQLILRDAEVKARDTLSQAYSAKQSVEREIVLLRSTESDFRFKFRAVLEGYLKQLEAAEAGAHERAGEFERQTRALRDAISESGRQPAAAAAPPAATSGTEEETVVTDAAASAPERAATSSPRAAAGETPAGPAPSDTRPEPQRQPVGRQTPSSAARQTHRPEARAASANGGENGVDTASLAAPDPRRPLPEEQEDDFFADVDDRVGGKEFKW